MRRKFEKRKKDAAVRAARKRARKNFLPTLVVISILWGLIALIIYTVDPISTGAVPLFFCLLFVALIFTMSTIYANTRRGILTSIVITLFMVLKYFGIGSLLNLFLIAGLAFSIEIYFSQSGS